MPTRNRCVQHCVFALFLLAACPLRALSADDHAQSSSFMINRPTELAALYPDPGVFQVSPPPQQRQTWTCTHRQRCTARLQSPMRCPLHRNLRVSRSNAWCRSRPISESSRMGTRLLSQASWSMCLRGPRPVRARVTSMPTSTSTRDHTHAHIYTHILISRAYVQVAIPTRKKKWRAGLKTYAY